MKHEKTQASMAGGRDAGSLRNSFEWTFAGGALLHDGIPSI